MKQHYVWAQKYKKIKCDPCPQKGYSLGKRKYHHPRGCEYHGRLLANPNTVLLPKKQRHCSHYMTELGLCQGPTQTVLVTWRNGLRDGGQGKAIQKHGTETHCMYMGSGYQFLPRSTAQCFQTRTRWWTKGRCKQRLTSWCFNRLLITQLPSFPISALNLMQEAEVPNLLSPLWGHSVGITKSPLGWAEQEVNKSVQERSKQGMFSGLQWATTHKEDLGYRYTGVWKAGGPSSHHFIYVLTVWTRIQKKEAGIENLACGYQPVITNAMFVCSEMLSQVWNAFHSILPTHCPLCTPAHRKDVLFYMHLGFGFTIKHSDQPPIL